MKWIKYQLNNLINVGTDDEPVFVDNLSDKALSYCEANLAIAKKEAYNGEYTIENDGIEEFAEPTQLDRIEAQVTYNSLILGTLIQEE